jgi:sulfur carrier protein ThiS
MMKIKVSLFGALKSPLGHSFQLELSGRTTIKDILRKTLKYKAKDVKYLVYFINSKPAAITATLKDKDELKVLLLVGGG